MQLPKFIADRILWIDWIGGAVVGTFVLLASGWLSGLYGLSQSLVVWIAIANLIYASFSLTLCLFPRTRTRTGVSFLALANMGWLVICLILIAAHLRWESAFGLSQLALEGCYVGALGFVEWKLRDGLALPNAASNDSVTKNSATTNGASNPKENGT